MKGFLGKSTLQEFTTKLNAKLKTIFPTKTEVNTQLEDYVPYENDGSIKGVMKADNLILSSNNYGDTLPMAGTVGRVFFKKVT